MLEGRNDGVLLPSGAARGITVNVICTRKGLPLRNGQAPSGVGIEL